jgi:hypothetical protein
VVETPSPYADKLLAMADTDDPLDWMMSVDANAPTT